MLLIDFKEVNALDEKISVLLSELSALYEKRKAITNSTSSVKKVTGSTFSSDSTALTTAWEHRQYEALQAAWMKYDLKIPTYKTLRSKLAYAKAIIANLPTAMNGEECFELFLVPPTGKFAFPFDDQVLNKQQLTEYQGLSEMNVPAQEPQSNWKLMIVYNGPKGLPIVDYKEFIDNEQYKINGYSMRDLDLRGYGLYALLKNDPIDVDSWSLLPASKISGKHQVVSAGFVDKQYRWVIDDTRSLLGKNSFRPAMEIKS